MTRRDALLEASSKANAIILETNMKTRVRDGGYTRIDPALVASLFQVPVMYRNLDKLLGGFIRDGSMVGILVNADRPPGLVHMTCAHELGHFFLGHESAADQSLDHGLNAALVERQADQFAYSLLAPRWLVATAMRARQWSVADLSRPPVIYQMSLRLGISYTAMAWSLQRLGLIDTDLVERILMTPPKSLKQQAIGGQKLKDGHVDVWVLDAADRDHVLEPGYGDLFVVDLPNHAGSGYLWSIDELQSEGFQLDPMSTDRRLGSQPDPADVVIGGTATIRYELKPPEDFRQRRPQWAEPVLAADLHRRVQMQEGQPWSDEAQTKVDAFGFRAEYDPKDEGLTVFERLTRVARAQRTP